MSIYTHAHDIFLRLLGDGYSFLEADEGRAAFTREHLFCNRCDSIKHKSCFYIACGQIVYPCKQCNSEKTRMKWVKTKLERASGGG